VEELLEAVGGFENLRNLAVQFANHLVDGLLPGWVRILSGNDGVEELSKSHLGYLQKSIRNLKEKKGNGQREKRNINALIAPLTFPFLCPKLSYLFSLSRQMLEAGCSD